MGAENSHIPEQRANAVDRFPQLLRHRFLLGIFDDDMPAMSPNPGAARPAICITVTASRWCVKAPAEPQPFRQMVAIVPTNEGCVPCHDNPRGQIIDLAVQDRARRTTTFSVGTLFYCQPLS
jgi:hypothetical protein